MAADQDDFQRAGRPLLGVPVAVRRIGLCAITGAISLALLSACGSSSNGSSPSGAAGTGALPPAQTASAGSAAAGTASTPGSAPVSAAAGQSAPMIMIDKFSYTTPLTVSPGARVSVMNMDGENHTVTADSGNAFDDKATAGTTTTFTAPSAPGSYPYHCTYHSNMHGVLIVK
jgi:plastocyanin